MDVNSLTVLHTHKKTQTPPAPPKKTKPNNKKTPIFLFLLQNELTLNSHPILPIWLERQNSRINVLCTCAQCQEEAERNKTLKYLYCKLNLPGSCRMLKIKPWLTSDFLNGKRNIYGTVFIP